MDEPAPKEPDPNTPPFAEFKPEECEAAIAQLARYGEAISKEFTLVSDRMTWMVIAESFIFTAYATAGGYYSTQGQSPGMRLVLGFVLVLMPALGIFLAWVVTPAIYAAHEAARRLKARRTKYERRLPARLRIRLMSSKGAIHSAGNIPPRYVPWVIIGIWSVLLVVAVVGLCLA